MTFCKVKHYFKNKKTNEIFPIETSFVIPDQALTADPKYKLAMLEGQNYKDFEFIETTVLSE